MLGKNYRALLLKTDRISAWILFFLFIIFIITGFSMTGEYGMSSLVGVQQSIAIHTGLCGLIILFFAIHSGIRIYFMLIRRGLLKK